MKKIGVQALKSLISFLCAFYLVSFGTYYLTKYYGNTYYIQCSETSSLNIPSIINEQGKPKHALLELLNFLDVQHDGTLESIVQRTQEQWLRQQGKERWEIEEKFPEKHEELMLMFNRLCCIEEVSPKARHYNYAFILGALIGRVRLRLAYLLEQWNKGIRFDTLVLLGGERPLDSELESPEKLLDISGGNLPFKKGWQPMGDLPKIETEMMRFVLDQIEFPEGFENVIILFVDTPMQETASSMRRPSTADTINYWLQTSPMPGSCLAISNQPYVGYQDAVLRRFLPADFTVETVGPTASKNTKNAVLLDNIARWLYQEQKCLSKELGN